MMRKTDYLAFIVIICINVIFLRIIYKNDYWITLAGSEALLHDMVDQFFVWGQAFAAILIFLPRYLDFMKRRQIRIEIGDIDPSWYLNYHPDDVIMT